MPSTWRPRWFNSTLLLLDELAVSIDPKGLEGSGDLVLISHAHGDHVAGFRLRGLKVCSEATAELYHAQFGRSVSAKLQQLPSKLHFESLELRLEEAGHLLGASQFQLYHPEMGCLTYTGDLNVEGSIIHRPPPVLDCDVLVVDATFGHPLLKFPPRQELYEEVVKWVSRTVEEGYTPVLHAHSVGKAQEVVKVLNEYLGLEPLVHPKVARVSEVYLKHGVSLRFKSLKPPLEEGLKGCEVFVAPLLHRPLRAPLKKMRNAVVTGWASVFSYSAFDKAFPLSGHSGFPELVSYIEATGARRVYTLGYYAEEMAGWLRKRCRLEAEALSGRHERARES
jgi:putative mRNA 3-end processing factor